MFENPSTPRSPRGHQGHPPVRDGLSALALAAKECGRGKRGSLLRPPTNGPRQWISFSLRGLACLVHILWIWLIIRSLVWAVRSFGWTVLMLVHRFENRVLAPGRVALWSRTDKKELISRPGPSVFDIDSLGLEPDQLRVLKASTRSTPRVELGEFDQDGFLLSKVGPIRAIPGVATKDFVRRNRCTLRLVLLGNSVGVEKDFRGVKSSFVRELTALRRLNTAGCRVPAILDVDVKKCRLTLSFIKGKVLREELAKAGAVLRDRDVAERPEYRGLSLGLTRLMRIEAGRKVLRQVVTEDFVDKLYWTLQDIHTAGVTPIDIKYGNIIIEAGSGEPCLIDFDAASAVKPLAKSLLALLRDRDTDEFNLHFGTHHVTYDQAKARLREMETPAPVYFGHGLCLGKAWTAIARYGRWLHFIKHNLPDLAGKRVLNLGAGNGFPALQLLRSGARQVVAIEHDANLVKQGQFVKEAFEWADNRRYALEWLQLDKPDLVTHDLGRFEVVFAPDCLDCPDAQPVADLVKHISTITQVLVCQSRCPEDSGRSNRRIDKVELLQHSARLLHENGFRVSRFSAQPFDSRDLIVAETA